MRKCSTWLGALAAACLALPAMAEDTIKVAYIDPLSGPFASVGEHIAREITLVMERINAAGGPLGRKFELVTFDSKASPQEALIAFRQMSDQGIHFLLQGSSSAVAGALSEAIAKQGARNPEQAVVFLNHAALDPALTNERCNFWHFRFDADADMKMQALTNVLASQRKIKKVYLINQDYAFGQAVERAARAMIARKRPDIQIVGADLHPLGKVKDFSPYVAKIKASGADTVLTGNWGADLSLLVKASRESSLNVDYYTYWANVNGSTTAIGAAGDGHVKLVTNWHANVGDSNSTALAQAYRKRFPEPKDDFFLYTVDIALQMLTRAMNETRSTDPLRVARALEGMKYPGFTGEVTMRADNHQLLQPMYVATLSRSARMDIERTGLGYVSDGRVDAKDTALPTTCKMQRP